MNLIFQFYTNFAKLKYNTTLDGALYRKEAVGEVHDSQGMVVAWAGGAGVHLVRRSKLFQVPTQDKNNH